MSEKLLHRSMRVGIFLLRGAGGAAIGIFVGFVVSYFFRFPGRIDAFAFAETMLGVVITGLAIVGAFMVVLQWSNLDSRIHTFDIKVKETTEFFDKQAERMTKIGQDVDNYVKLTVDGYNEKVGYLQNLLEENAKIANEINSKIEENEERFAKRQNQFEERERALEESQKKRSKMIEDYEKLLDRVDKALESGSKQAATD